MVEAIVRIEPAPEQRPRALEILRSVRGPTRAIPGCLACRIYEESEGEEGLMFFERWDSESALREHVGSDLYRRVLEAIELSEMAPEIYFHPVASQEGIEWIKEVRNGSGSGRNHGVLKEDPQQHTTS